jgi:deazaflavin-dependent oxidoreductase (nitroreductase family)
MTRSIRCTQIRVVRGRIQRRLEKSVFNPLFRAALRLGIAPHAFALLETTGRRSGRRRLTPVGNGFDGEVFWLVSEHGRGGDYVKNLIANPSVRVKAGRRWYRGTAVVIDDDDAHARRRRLDEANGVIGRADGVIFRASASVPVTIRIDLHP